jgi:hypothetical protein
VYHAFSIASTITCRASSLLHKFGANHPSSPTDVANHLAFNIDFKLWNTSAPYLNPSWKLGAQTGTIINSWISTLLSA